MSVKFIHIADTHLGVGGFGNRLNDSGLNQREEDVCSAFTASINKIIELKPGFVIHAGDLFHAVRPTNRIINFAIQQILRLSKAGIPIVIISGNHDAPKQRSVGHVLSIFENFEKVYPIFRSKYEIIEFDDVAIGCLPHCLTPEILQAQFENIKPVKDKINILVAHGVVAGIDRFSMAELSEEEIPSSVMNQGFDYVALGHYHKFTEVEERIYYSGSTERLSFGELGEDKGLLEVILPEFKVDFHQINIRGMLDLPVLDAQGLDYDELNENLQSRFDSVDLIDKIVRLKILNLSEVLYNNLPVKEIRLKTKDAFHFKLITEREETQNIHLNEEMKFGKLLDEFNDYLGNRPVEKLDKSRLRELAKKYFREIEE